MGISSHFSFAFLLFTATCKASSDSHFAFLHFFSMGMVLIPVSCGVGDINIRWSGQILSREVWRLHKQSWACYVMPFKLVRGMWNSASATPSCPHHVSTWVSWIMWVERGLLGNLWRKHTSLESRIQLESFILSMVGHPGDDGLGGIWGSLKRIHEGMSLSHR